MAAAKIELKSPLSPFFKGGFFSVRILTALWKEGERGDFQME
jgi:hypothetical protein